MGDQASPTNAQSLREVLVGLDRSQQHEAAAHWAVANGRVVDMFGDFARDRHLLLFCSGNECENWIDPAIGMVYKMNMLTHVGENLLRLLDRVDTYNLLFPETSLTFVGLQLMDSGNVFPVFAQPFVDDASFASPEEIADYMLSRGFEPTGNTDGQFADGHYLLSDLRPKNVLKAANGAIFVIDVDIELL